MKKKNNSRYIGKAGEHAVASQLYLREIVPMVPEIDEGVDIVTLGGVRIQVKTCSRRYLKVDHTHAAYIFVLGQADVRYESGYVRRRGARKFSSQCDFVVCWGADENRFWVIPAHEVDGLFKLALGSPSRWRDVDEETIHAQHAAGMSLRAIAEKHGVGYDTIDRVIKGEHVRSKFGIRRKRLNSYENAWHLIEEFSELAQERPILESAEAAAQPTAEMTKEKI